MKHRIFNLIGQGGQVRRELVEQFPLGRVRGEVANQSTLNRIRPELF
jgi:hypothetical protein